MDALATGGRLTVRVKRSRGWSPLQPFQPGVRVLVADNGAGIARSDVPHIFEAFYTTKVDVGTGLGLWVSQGVVQKHGGTIKVRSRTGQGRSGSVFSVFLPSRR
jgi:signal transduction histidine kinase